MSLDEKIIRQLHELSESKKTEVLDFVEYLRAKTREEDWTRLSLAAAMSGMEAEESPYDLNDLKESFS